MLKLGRRNCLVKGWIAIVLVVGSRWTYLPEARDWFSVFWLTPSRSIEKRDSITIGRLGWRKKLGVTQKGRQA
jgi:hypothetical protein